MKALLEAELTKITNEIDALETLRERLAAILVEADRGEAQPKKRGRKPKKVGLPSAVPPASEAKL